MKIAFIGCGSVGGALADHLQRLGHEVSLAQTGERGKSIEHAVARNPALSVRAAVDAVRDAQVVFLATPFQANESALGGVARELSGKVLVDCTNPVGPGLTHGLKSERSGASVVASLAPGAKVVKAFSVYGFENFEDSAYPGYGVKPAMFFCGDDAAAKATVADLIAALGWAPLDVGGLEQALHLEHMTLLWVRMVRAKGGSPHVVWAALRREAGGKAS
jgi:8-hydroxy-5-deazaflavin:NADPH oxidoreductase